LEDGAGQLPQSLCELYAKLKNKGEEVTASAGTSGGDEPNWDEIFASFPSVWG